MKRLMISLSLLLLVNLTGCAGTVKQEETVIWRLAHEESAGSIQDQYSQEFKRLVEERTNGEVNIKVFQLGQLGDGVGNVELLRYGIVDFGFNNPATVATIIPEVQLFNLHFLFSQDLEKNKMLLENSDTIRKMNGLYEEKDMRVLTWIQEGWQIVSSQKPITTPEDMKGYKVRVMASPLLLAAYESYGASPVSLPYMEIYSNLQLNMIDGQVNPMFAIDEMKFYEVQNYITKMDHEMFVGTFCSNPEFFDSLSPEHQEIVTDVVEDLEGFAFELMQQEYNTSLQSALTKSDVELLELDKEQRDSFVQMSIANHKNYIDIAGEIGAELLDSFKREIS